MKRRLTLLLALGLWLLAANAQKTKTLTILHTNDTHSCILPLNAQLADTMLAGETTSLLYRTVEKTAAALEIPIETIIDHITGLKPAI